MIYLSQRDPRWAGKVMAPSSLTLGRYGCTTTCISMLSDYFKCFEAPNWVALHNLKYNAQGKIIWGSIQFDKMKFEKRLFGFNPDEIDASIKDKDKAVILEVANGSHWVVALRKVPFSSQYFIADPWDGKLKLSSAYKNITGSAHFLRK